ncbi:hypothetical protein [Sphingomonas sp. CFBP9019]|jgi:hypothetical protein|uniref:pPIWI-associating nuclease domain-containing protein n=1 Tax=Sphingomonas sp. CFBP9019 TaxID=3096532 RepID=UPI002A6B0928|nr:hypothetical protein [Sphingomonas sp. CFBP9019]MDY1010233.1 hypothetical protein [Sphingomonas sp. CFBP9019]
MVGTTAWADVEDARRGLIALLPRDRFLKSLCKGAITVGRDKTNPIRGNLVASALRELATHVLHSLAPDDEVRRCVWFEQAKDTKTVTRGQRARYIVQAGLPDDFVKEKLKVDTAAMAKPLLDAMDKLHKATHVRVETVVRKGSAVREMLYEVITEVHTLLEDATEARGSIKDAVGTALHNAVFESMILDTIQELDELSTHTRIDGHWIDEIEVRRLDAREIEYCVTGEVEVELQYGSNSDVASDIGMRSDDSYPYKVKVVAEAGKPLDIDAEAIRLTVDTSSFYE